MRVSIDMPKVNYEMEFGIVGAWRKAVGEPVAAGDIVADIETEKAVVELASPASGTLVEIIHRPGTEVPCLEPIGWLEVAG